MRKEILGLLDLKNAQARSEWVRKYFSGHFCDDQRSEAERLGYLTWYVTQRAKANRFLRGSRSA